MATHINWCYFPEGNTAFGMMPGLGLLDLRPVPVLPMVMNDPARSYAAGNNPNDSTNYGRCPGFLSYLQNMYAIVSPFDLVINLVDGRVVGVETPCVDVSSMLMVRTDGSASGHALISLRIQYLFYSKEEVTIEQLPPFMDYTLMKQGVTVIPGAYSIAKWLRPVEIPLEIAKGVTSVNIKAGTPLTYLRFVPKNGGAVSLQEVEFSPELHKVVSQCAGLKRIRKNTPLEQCYAYAKNVMDKLLRPKRCPFGFGKK